MIQFFSTSMGSDVHYYDQHALPLLSHFNSEQFYPEEPEDSILENG